MIFPITNSRSDAFAVPGYPQGADEDLGNYVIIDHGDGEHSVLPHMKPGSVRVKKGHRVRQGEMIGEVGFSGDAIFPHVHYSLLSRPDIYRFEAVSAYFHKVNRIAGSRVVETRQVARRVSKPSACIAHAPQTWGFTDGATHGRKERNDGVPQILSPAS